MVKIMIFAANPADIIKYSKKLFTAQPLENSLGKELKIFADDQIRQFKKKYSPNKISKLNLFSKEFSTHIKKIRQLNQMQIDKILLQIGLSK